MLSVNNPVSQNPGVCAALYNSSAEGVNWLGKNTKVLAASAGETLSKTWAVVSSFFTTVAQKLGTFLVAAKDTLSAGFTEARHSIGALPASAKIVGLLGLVATAVTAVICRDYFAADESEDESGDLENVQNPAHAVPPGGAEMHDGEMHAGGAEMRERDRV